MSPWEHNHNRNNYTPPISSQKWEATRQYKMGRFHANTEWWVGMRSKNSSKTFEDCHAPPLLAHHDTSILDSGCTGHFLLINNQCCKKTKNASPLCVRMSIRDAMDSKHTALLKIPELYEAASLSYVFPDMANNSLLGAVSQTVSQVVCQVEQ